MKDTFRRDLVKAVWEAKNNLRRYDRSQMALPHTEGCDCMRWECVKARLDALPKVDITAEELAEWAKAVEEA